MKPSGEERIVLYLTVKDMEEVVALANAIEPWREKIFRPRSPRHVENMFVRRQRRHEQLLRALVPGEEYTMTDLARRLGKNAEYSYKTLQRDLAEMSLAGIVTLRIGDRSKGNGARTYVQLKI